MLVQIPTDPLFKDVAIEALPLTNPDFNLKDDDEQFQITREQFIKLQGVVPKHHHLALLCGCIDFNKAPLEKQLKDTFPMFFGGVCLFVGERDGLIHLEIGDDLQVMQFFKMDTHTNIVIHELPL